MLRGTIYCQKSIWIGFCGLTEVHRSTKTALWPDSREFISVVASIASTRACWYACAFSPARVEGSGDSASKERLKLFADVNPSITSAAAAIFFARSTIVLVLCAMASFESEIRQQQLHTVRKIPYITTTLQICTSVFGLRIARLESASRLALQYSRLHSVISN